jgi:pyrimidine oxygenase
MQVGVFRPIGNNGWLISTASPHFKPSFDLNRAVMERAERYGMEFVLSGEGERISLARPF